MFAVRQGVQRGGAGTPQPWHATRKPRPHLSVSGPVSGIELGYLTLTLTLAAILGVAVASLSTTQSVAPALAGARPGLSTINAATTGTGRITGGDRTDPTLIHNLGARSAVNSAMGSF
jgi:hypothetical protein